MDEQCTPQVSKPPGRALLPRAQLLNGLFFLVVLASQMSTTNASCETVELDAVIGTSDTGASAYWSGADCVRGSSPSPQARDSALMVAIGDGGALLFSGKGLAGDGATHMYYTDVHLRDMESGDWVRLPTTGTTPSARTKQSAVSWETEHGEVKVTIFAGESVDNKMFQDVHTLDVTTAVWSVMKTTGLKPSARHGHSAVSWRKSSGAWFMSIFSGIAEGGANSDVYTLDLTTREWSGPLQTSGSPPAARHSHTAVAWGDSGEAKMTVAFGQTIPTGCAPEALHEVHTLDLKTNIWTNIPTHKSLARASHTAVVWDKEQMTVYGGRSSTCVSSPGGCCPSGPGNTWTTLGDAYTLNLATSTWSSAVATTGTAPSNRSAHVAVSWRANASAPGGSSPRMMIGFGIDKQAGMSVGYADVYDLDLASHAWSGTLVINTPAALPASTQRHTAVSWQDASDAWQMTLFGGKSGNAAPNNELRTLGLNTGVWNFNIAAAGTLPSERFGHSAVTWFDTPPTMDGAVKMTIFGGEGRSPGTLHNDTHVLDLASYTWMAQSVMGNVPKMRCFHTAIAWRNTARAGQWTMTVFGGQDTDMLSLNDIHHFDLYKATWFDHPNAATGSLPEGRMKHTAVSWLSHTNTPMMTIFAGMNVVPVPIGVRFTKLLSDVYTLNLETHVWICVTSASETDPWPSAREGHTAISWRAPGSGAPLMIVFAGKQMNTPLTFKDDMWMLDLVSNEWSSTVVGDPPPRRSAHSAVLWSDKQVTIYGGDASPHSVVSSTIYTATLLARDGFVSITNSASDR